MLKIKNIKIKKYEFAGDVSLYDLSKEQLAKLKIDVDTAHSDEVEVFGDFSVTFDGNEPTVTVDSLTIEGAAGITLDLDDKDYDSEMIAGEIQEHDDGNWYQDHLESLGDKAYDDMRDRE